jgi:Tol biopolymer transport system component/DNA-binding winged helix-turn-helix (wHTH) protein
MESGGFWRFGPFDVDIRAGSLKKHGTRLRLPEQSFRILQLLLERHGEIVAREEICLRLWPNDTVVEYDHSINTAVRRLRSALGEAAEKPRYIETVAKRGYRFIAAVEIGKSADAGANEQSCRYRLLDVLGEGGIGVVYRAEDLKLGRHVAVKLLRPGKGGLSESAVRRFEQEARTASALNHPNICTIHGLEEIEGRAAIVMELVEGETLAARLSGHARLPVSDALRIARQIASALAEAHAAGVTHGDVKPANIMLSKNGVIVLDFGLARIDKPEGAETDGKTSSGNGRMSGTLHYMSPEHALGKVLDARSDVFSFGLLLHEMLGGRRAFDGDNAEAVIASILKQPTPPLPDVPAPLARVIARCLAKDANARWQSGRDLETELERVGEEREEAVLKRRPSVLTWLAGVAILATLALASLALIYPFSKLGPKGRESAPIRVVPLTTMPGPSTYPAFSPDGQKVAFSWLLSRGSDKQRRQSIYIKPIGNGDPVPLTQSDISDDRLPQWSPDGKSIAFQRTTATVSTLLNELMIVSADGGPPQKIADMGIGLSWSPDGKEIAYVAPYAPVGSGGLVVRSLATGKVRELTKPKPYAEGIVAWSPDGQTIAFLRTLTESARDVFVVSSSGGEPKRLTFDAQIIEGLAWTPDSREIVFVSHRFGGPNIWRIAASGGTPERVASVGHHPAYPAISRSGDRLAFSETFNDSNVWRYEFAKAGEGSTRAPLASSKCLVCSTLEDDSPRFSPDGRKIVFVSKRTGSDEIWVADSDGGYPTQVTSMGGTPTGSPRWSPDGHWIAFDSRSKGSPDIFVVAAQGGSPRQLTPENSADLEPSWSRDGRWVYFASNRGGYYQIWKAPFEGGAARRVTQGSGLDPIESPDGNRLYYFRPDAEGMWTAPVAGGREEQIPELGRLKRTRVWMVRENGIYFYEDGPGSHLVRIFSFATRRVTTALTLAVAPARFVPGLDVSPDGRTLLYTQTDQKIEGLFMIENFR